jgi:RNA polymerase sigma-70 factor (ECF subfamily)
VEEFSVLPEGRESEPDYLLIRRELCRTVQETVRQLPESKKEIISLFLEEDLTMQEMAERLGIPEGTVKSRFYYARLDLKDRLADEI